MSRWRKCIRAEKPSLHHNVLAEAEAVCGVFVTDRSVRLCSRKTRRRLCVLTSEHILLFDCEHLYQTHLEVRRQRVLAGYSHIGDDLNDLCELEASSLQNRQTRRVVASVPLSHLYSIREVNAEELHLEARYGRLLILQTDDSAISARQFCDHFLNLQQAKDYSYDIFIRTRYRFENARSKDGVPPWTVEGSKTKHNDDCVMCLEPLDVDTIVNLHPCQHSLHQACAQVWMNHDLANRDSLACPICRTDLLVGSTGSDTMGVNLDVMIT